MVRHRLADHPLFAYDALAALCRRLPPAQVPFRFGVVPPDAEFDSSLERFRGALTLDEAIEHLEERQAYIAIYNAETDPQKDRLLAEIGEPRLEYRPSIERKAMTFDLVPGWVSIIRSSRRIW